MKKNKGNRGITLISLIITIIIMLILVAVTITTVINSGLIEKAKEAGEGYKTAAEKEASLGEIEVKGKKYASIEEFIAKKEKIEEIHNWKRDGDTLTCTCEQCKKENGEQGRILTIGTAINYTKTGKGTSIITVEKSWAEEYGDQTVNKDAETVWVVLGVEDSNENGTNETLLLTTSKPTNDKIAIWGSAAYNYGADEIERMCKEIYGEEASGMTIEDVNNCLQYKPEGAVYLYNGQYIQVKNFTTTLNSLPVWSDFISNGTASPVASTEEALGSYVLNNYWYKLSDDQSYLVEEFDEADKSHTITEASKNVIFGSDTRYYYYLASSGVSGLRESFGFGIGYVSFGKAEASDWLCQSSGDSDTGVAPIRAVVRLRSTIPNDIDETVDFTGTR